MEEEISIKINVEDRFYPLRIPASEESLVRNTAKQINQRAKYYRDNFSVKDKQDALAMVALEYGTEKLNLEENENQFLQEINDVLDQIENKLA